MANCISTAVLTAVLKISKKLQEIISPYFYLRPPALSQTIGGNLLGKQFCQRCAKIKPEVLRMHFHKSDLYLRIEFFPNWNLLPIGSLHK